MPKDFGAWFSEQGKDATPEVDATFSATCTGCGKHEYSISLRAYRNGDTGWYIEYDVYPDDDYEGLCGGSVYCTP